MEPGGVIFGQGNIWRGAQSIYIHDHDLKRYVCYCITIISVRMLVDIKNLQANTADFKFQRSKY